MAMKERSNSSNSLFESRKVYASGSDLETIEIASSVAKELKSGDVVFLHGDLGAGKTTFVKGLAFGLGIDLDEVNSPTFNYLNLYETLAHFDLYRVETLDQFMMMGFDEYLESPYIACIEWPEILAPLNLQGVVRVALQHSEFGRVIEITRG